jgi:diamine N-acetyltransferase
MIESLNFSIRLAVVEDFLAISSLIGETDELHRAARPDLFRKPEGPPRDFEFIANLIAGPNSAILAAEDDASGELVGFVIVRILEVAPNCARRARRFAEIGNLGVAKHARRRGIGETLVKHTFQWASARDVDAIELVVYEFNAGAISFYEALGFDVITRRLGYRMSVNA